MVQRRSRPYTLREADLGLVQLCRLLLGTVVWQLDARLEHDWYWPQLVAGDHRHLSFAAHQLGGHVIQLALRQRLSHRLSSRG